MAGEMNGYSGPGAIQDVNDHPEMNLPDPGYQPRAVHGVEMAGDVLPFPVKDIAPTSTSVKNDISRRSGRSGGENVVKPIFK